jgi:hypothetical protein
MSLPRSNDRGPIEAFCRSSTSSNSVCNLKRGATDLGKVSLPEVERIHCVAGMHRALGLDEARCDGVRRRATASW